MEDWLETASSVILRIATFLLMILMATGLLALILLIWRWIIAGMPL